MFHVKLGSGRGSEADVHIILFLTMNHLNINRSQKLTNVAVCIHRIAIANDLI